MRRVSPQLSPEQLQTIRDLREGAGSDPETRRIYFATLLTFQPSRTQSDAVKRDDWTLRSIAEVVGLTREGLNKQMSKAEELYKEGKLGEPAFTAPAVTVFTAPSQPKPPQPIPMPAETVKEMQRLVKEVRGTRRPAVGVPLEDTDNHRLAVLVHTMHAENHQPIRVIAEAIGSTPGAEYKRLQRHGLTIAPPSMAETSLSRRSNSASTKPPLPKGA